MNTVVESTLTAVTVGPAVLELDPDVKKLLLTVERALRPSTAYVDYPHKTTGLTPTLTTSTTQWPFLFGPCVRSQHRDGKLSRLTELTHSAAKHALRDRQARQDRKGQGIGTGAQPPRGRNSGSSVPRSRRAPSPGNYICKRRVRTTSSTTPPGARPTPLTALAATGMPTTRSRVLERPLPVPEHRTSEPYTHHKGER